MCRVVFTEKIKECKSFALNSGIVGFHSNVLLQIVRETPGVKNLFP